MSDYDAIVVGAGHNGLSAGSVLAREGLSVLCLEKTQWSGGMGTTQELFEGFKHNVGAWALIVFRDKMLEMLGLEDYGLELIRPSTSYTVIGTPEDTPLISYRDQNKMAEHLMTDHGPDVLEALAGFAGYLETFRAVMDEHMFKPPTSINAIIAEAPEAKTREILMKIFYGSAVDILNEFFPDPNKHGIIRGSMCQAAIDGTHMGPHSAGSALSMAYHLTAGDGMDFRTPKGGIGKLSEALAKAIEDHGGEVRHKSEVKRFLIEDRKVTGVKLKSGEKITAKVVLSNLDAHATFLRLTDEDQLPQEFVNSLKEIGYDNGFVQIHMTLKGLPEFAGHLEFLNEEKLFATLGYVKSPDHLARCWRQHLKGEIPDDPVASFAIPSLIDPSLAPEGYHTCTFFSHYFPYKIPQGKQNEYREIMADRVIGQIAQYAPNLRDIIMDKIILSNTYFEKTFGATKGDYARGLVHPGLMWDRRPVPGWANYRTPLENLYMCGGACHPGPGITCVPGYNCANEVLSDLQ